MYKSGSLRAPLFVGLNDKMNMKNGQSEEPRKADHGDGSEENHGDRFLIPSLLKYNIPINHCNYKK